MTRHPASETKVRLLLGSGQEVDTVRTNIQWLEAIPGAKFGRRIEYPVKIDGVRKTAVCVSLTSSVVKEDAVKFISEENNIEVARDH
jgi:hypothetical protein